MTDDDIIRDILAREGGYVDRPEDRGGPTKYGITLATLSGWRKRQVTAADVQALTEAEAWDIYRHRYIGEPGFATLGDVRLRALLVDSGVHSGPKNAVRFLQRALGVPADGVLGPVTRAAIWQVEPRKLWLTVFAERLQFIGRLISNDLTDADRDGIPDNAEFAAGWLNRLGSLLKEAA